VVRRVIAGSMIRRRAWQSATSVCRRNCIAETVAETFYVAKKRRPQSTGTVTRNRPETSVPAFSRGRLIERNPGSIRDRQVLQAGTKFPGQIKPNEPTQLVSKQYGLDCLFFALRRGTAVLDPSRPRPAPWYQEVPRWT
jgi:hypothetical protein